MKTLNLAVIVVMEQQQMLIYIDNTLIYTMCSKKQIVAVSLVPLLTRAIAIIMIKFYLNFLNLKIVPFKSK